MDGCISIDFRLTKQAVPNILDLIASEGYELRSIRLIPCKGDERSTLRLGIGGVYTRSDFDVLEHRLRTLGETIDVIHCAAAR